MPLEIVRNDITKMQVDALVNTANPRPVVGGGVDRAIHKAAGAELLAARKEIGDIAVGKAVVTPAYNLPAEYVIHTVGPVWQDGKHGERELLAECYANSFRLAMEHQCSSIAFPLISAGVYGCPPEIAITAATQAIREFLLAHEMDVYLVVFDRRSFKISSSLFDDVQNYLDEMYVEELLDEEYRGDDRGRRRRAFDEASCMAEDVIALSPASKEKQRSLEDLLDEIDDKIRNNPAYQPSKTTALAFAVALELNLDETRDFIGRAGYAISHSNKMDIIVEYFIKRKEYDIFTVNEVLFSYGQPLLGS